MARTRGSMVLDFKSKKTRDEDIIVLMAPLIEVVIRGHSNRIETGRIPDVYSEGDAAAR